MVVCGLCGTTKEAAPLSWTMVVEGADAARRTVYFCETCSRANLRSLEAGLDPEYW